MYNPSDVWHRSSAAYGSFSTMASTQLRTRASAYQNNLAPTNGVWHRSSDVNMKPGFAPMPQMRQAPVRDARSNVVSVSQAALSTR